MTGQLACVANFNVVDPSSAAVVGEMSIPPSTTNRARALASTRTSSMGSDVAAGRHRQSGPLASHCIGCFLEEDLRVVGLIREQGHVEHSGGFSEVGA
jgi:hypothetical protein